MGGRRLIIINALTAQDFAPFTRGWNTTHVLYNITQHAQVDGSRSTAMAVAYTWSWHVHVEIAWRPEEGKPGAKAPAAALTLCCVVVRRCVARGDVHGDATASNIECAGSCQPYEKGRRSERAWRDVRHMWALLSIGREKEQETQSDIRNSGVANKHR